MEALWTVVGGGTVAAICSDHSPYTVAEKEAGNEDIFKAPLGLNVIQVMLPAVLDGSVNPGRVFDRTVDLDHISDGYRAMNDREALKVLVTV